MRALEQAKIPFDENLVRPVRFGANHITDVTRRVPLDRSVTALIECSGAEDANSIREGARRAGRTAGQDVDVVVWTYTNNATILSEAAAHIWLPAREAAAEGLEQLADWIQERRKEPISIIYRPRLYHPGTGFETPKPEPLFDLRNS